MSCDLSNNSNLEEELLEDANFASIDLPNNELPDRPVSPGQESEDSSISFHSLKEQIQNLNIDDTEYCKPSFMQKDTKEDSTWFDTAENISDDKENKDDYFIDEEYLKDLEISSTIEEKKFKQEEAQEIKTNANKKFKDNLFEEAAVLYSDALKICPISETKDRAILYANRAAARSKLNTDKEQLKEVIKDCDKAIEYDPSYLKAILRRANLSQQVDNLDEALKDFQRVLEIDPSHREAREAAMILPQQISERNERLKEEMMGKLKDLGNMILKPFGLSTTNFELKQDPNSGGYNISFNQNKS